ncbi:MAG TPA: social motility TPR repeat lipoprotein Tgl [Myxococcales bacterium]|jgi:type IV pilus biogenesis/stability protein PilW|nr:social motility TPR repeat lipoprotein Tgl [Myxococcales bacterium]
MLREDASRTHVRARREDIVAIYESANQPMVQIPGRAAQAAHGAIVALRRGRAFEILVVLTFTEAQDKVFYVSDAPVPQDELEAAVEEALNFAESMGFILDSNWAGLDADQKEETMRRMAAFQPPTGKQVEAPAERPKPPDALSAIARLFGAFALLCALASSSCSGVTAEQRRRSAEIHYDLGTNLLQNGDVQGALREYLTAEKEDSDLPQTHNALGLLYAYSLARPDDAEEEFKKALALDKDFSEARNNLGAFYMARGRFADAIPQFELALSNPLYRDRVIAESNLGWALYKTGQTEKGIRRIAAALLIAPKYCLGWRQLGTIHAERGELPAASDAFAKYAGACPDVADAHLQAAKILARQSRAAEARLEFQRCAGAKNERDAGIARECQRLLKELSP